MLSKHVLVGKLMNIGHLKRLLLHKVFTRVWKELIAMVSLFKENSFPRDRSVHTILKYPITE